MRADTSGKNERPPRLQFLGGKGGVGKTTCAAAFALLEAASRQRVLVASTDPAPSLGDALGVPLGVTPKRVVARLDAVEIAAPPVLRRWIAERRPSLEQIALQGTWLDREDVTRLLSLSLPGIDEIAALLEISRHSRNGRYDLVVVDTAPTGHTLRMLSMPETLFAIARVFDVMREKHRVMVAALRGAFASEAEDLLIEEMASEARALADMLRDRRRTRMSWVTLPEPMAIAETLAAFAELERRQITVSEIIVNQLTPKRRARCAHCDARRAFEATALRRIPAAVSTMHVLAEAEEPRGIPALRRVAAQLVPPPPRAAGGQRVRFTAVSSERIGTRYVSETEPQLKLLLFGGKGGVGKTTCAAATAVDIAARERNRRVLLISTDPAHSLRDVLATALSNEETRITAATPNLVVRELDASHVLDGVRRRYIAAIDELFARIGAGGGTFDVAHDRSVLHALIDLAPPGLDELAAIIEIAEAVSTDRPRFDLAVVDTAPTGHALRLLELPALIHDWTKALMAILLKYQPVTGLGELGALLLKLSRGLGSLRELLTDPSRTHFHVVTRAAALPAAETERLLERLDALRVRVPTIVINAVGRGSCAACRTTAAAERRQISRLKRSARARRRQLILAATEIPPPHGAVSLRRWRRHAWRVLRDTV